MASFSLLRHPGRTALFPLIVRQLLNFGAVRLHRKYLAIRLGRFGVEGLVLESHARSRKQQAFAIRRPGQVRVIAMRAGELREPRSECPVWMAPALQGLICWRVGQGGKIRGTTRPSSPLKIKALSVRTPMPVARAGPVCLNSRKIQGREARRKMRKVGAPRQFRVTTRSSDRSRDWNG
jgi:hypothetical protein